MNMNKYDITVDRRWLVFQYFLLTNLCFIISKDSNIPLLWIVNAVLFGVCILLEIILIIKIWWEGRKEK